MKWGLQHIAYFKQALLGSLLLLVLGFNFAEAQSTVKAEIDTTIIKIGAQINYKITVETDSTNLVHFPKDQTFSPLEMVEALKIDSTKNKNRITLQRIYALTQFDSGSYTIPQQRVQINEEPFLTDTFRIKVADVLVDTTKQKLYDIKPIIEVNKSRGKTIWIILLVLLILGLIAALIYWLVYKQPIKKRSEKEVQLPPYDRAIQGLKQLENSKYLIQEEYKAYYSELTDIVRSYLEEETHIDALESTTDQLIEKLELRKDAGKLDLTEDTILQFKKVLQTADLVKFAKSKPDDHTAEQDRKTVEQVVIKTKEAIPEPTLEELQLTQEYQEALAKKQRQKKLYWAIGITTAILFLIAGVFIIRQGVKYVGDTVFGHPTKELLEGEWVKSEYGYPPILIEAPKVLVRGDLGLGAEDKEKLGGMDIQMFQYGSFAGTFSITVSSYLLLDPEKEINLEGALEGMLGGLEAQGAKNILPKTEDFFSASGTQGVKTFGEVDFPTLDQKSTKRIEFAIISFAGKQNMAQIFITWDKNDEYAEKIVERILATVDVKTQG